MFDWGHDEPRLAAPSTVHRIRESDIPALSNFVFALINDHLSNPDMTTKPITNTNRIRLSLAEQIPSYVMQPVHSYHYFTIECDKAIRLEQLQFSLLRDENGDILDQKFDIFIKKKQTGNPNSERIYQNKFVVGGKANSIIEIPDGIEISPSCSYQFYARMKGKLKIYTDKTIETNHSIVV